MLPLLWLHYANGSLIPPFLRVEYLNKKIIVTYSYEIFTIRKILIPVKKHQRNQVDNWIK